MSNCCCSINGANFDSSSSGGADSINLSAGTQLATSGTVAFADSNGFSFGLQFSSRLTASGDFVRSVSAGTTNATGNQIVLSNGNGVSFGAAGQTITASVQGSTGAAIAAGTQTGSSGTIVMSNSNGLSFGMSNNSVVTATADYVRSLSAGTTNATGNQIVLSNSNNVSFGAAGATITASVSVPAGMAASAGSQSVSTGTVVFSNSNGLSFGMSGSSQITGSGDYVRSISAGTTNATGNQIVFSNSNGVSFGASGGTITASAGGATGGIAVAAGTQTGSTGTIDFVDSNGISWGLSGSSQLTANFAAIKSISAGTTQITGGQAVLSNFQNVTFGINGNTITASAPSTTGYTVSAYSQYGDFISSMQLSNATMSLVRASVPAYMNATAAVFIMSMNGASGSTGALTMSHAVYTLSGSTASLASSASRQLSWTSGSATSATGQFGGVSGNRYRSMTCSYAFTPGDYLFGFYFLTTNAGTWTLMGNGHTISFTSSPDGIDTNFFLDGISTSSFNTAFPSSIVATDTNYVRTGAGVSRMPGVILFGS